MIQEIAMIGSIALPLWNIPLIINMVKRKSSRDVSLMWAVGVWTCLLLMVPSGLSSSDIVWKVFCIFNFSMFSLVVITVFYFRKERK
ncbi:MAG: hypothetical protein HYZ84_06240 [Candidatus Omnitrophica bacterium]|nr:hypothetical protein [Candidatus Omnitrophota bacterium]